MFRAYRAFFGQSSELNRASLTYIPYRCSLARFGPSVVLRIDGESVSGFGQEDFPRMSQSTGNPAWEAVFVNHYAWLRQWARQLTAGKREDRFELSSGLDGSPRKESGGRGSVLRVMSSFLLLRTFRFMAQCLLGSSLASPVFIGEISLTSKSQRSGCIKYRQFRHGRNSPQTSWSIDNGQRTH
jgi:hypothetical protein